ncbi:MAG: aspartate aminotransferase family protein [Microbacteriaceae bacterium]|nr:aspartate aminotransferase family protein [Microbacteriaceae bacterium]
MSISSASPGHPPQRMHDHSPDLLAMVDNVIDYSRRRLIFDDVPLDKPQPERELRRLASGSITEDGIGARRALAMFENVLAPACLTVDHPEFLAFIPSAPSKASIAFDLVVSASSVYAGSWLEGSGAVFAENEVLRALADEYGMPPEAGGAFVQGGTIGNLSALVAARDARRRAFAAEGRERPARWVVICSEESHSSVRSAAEVMDVDVAVAEVDDDGRLHGEAVRPLLAEHGDAVFAVVATAGLTNLGIVDDVASIAALKGEFDFWLHVDGAYGLAAALLPELRPLFAGIEAADSLIVDPHKWLFAPFDACALLYRDPLGARLAHTQKAGYLDTLEGDDWNPSDFAVQLSRRARGLPLWYSLATHGLGAYRDAIRECVRVAHEIGEVVRSRPELELVVEPELSVVAFRRLGWGRAEYDEWSQRLLDEQLGFVTTSSHRGEPITRFAVVNPRTSVEGVTRILDTMR